MMDEACSPRLHFLISQTGFTCHPANFTPEWACLFELTRKLSSLKLLQGGKKKHNILYVWYGWLQHLFLISVLKLKVSIRLSRDIISAVSVFSTVARRTHGNQSRKQPQRRQQQRQQRQIGKRAQEWRPERVTEATYHPTRPNVPENRGSRTVGGSAPQSPKETKLPDAMAQCGPHHGKSCGPTAS